MIIGRRIHDEARFDNRNFGILMFESFVLRFSMVRDEQGVLSGEYSNSKI